MWWVLCVFVLAIIIYVQIVEYLKFRALQNIKRGDTAYTLLSRIKMEPTIFRVDNDKAFYIYFYLSWRYLLFPTKRIQSIVFTVEDGKIVYIG